MQITNESLSKRLPATRITLTEQKLVKCEAARLGVSISEYTRQAIRAYLKITKRGFSDADIA